MKLPHVVILSIIGMLVASLSVLVFTSPRRASHDDLTSNETETNVTPSASTTPKLTLRTETDATSSSVAPRTTPTQKTRSVRNKQEAMGWLQLTSVDEPCSFFVDGKLVKLENDVPFFVRVGPHKVKCVRQNGDTVEKRIDVVEEAINPVFF